MLNSIFILVISLIVSVINIFISSKLFSDNRCVENDGIAFGIGVEDITYITLILLLVLIVVGLRSKGVIKYILFSILLMGLSNLIVRVIYGSICDYINIFNLVINISDLFIVLFSIYAGIHILFWNNKE